MAGLRRVPGAEGDLFIENLVTNHPKLISRIGQTLQKARSIRVLSADELNVPDVGNPLWHPPYRAGSYGVEIEVVDVLKYRVYRTGSKDSSIGPWLMDDHPENFAIEELVDRYSLTYPPTNWELVGIRGPVILKGGECAPVARIGSRGGGFQWELPERETLKRMVNEGRVQFRARGVLE